MAFESLEQNCEEFMAEAVRIDSEVANIVKQRKEEFLWSLFLSETPK